MAAGRAYIFTFCTSAVAGTALGAYQGYNEKGRAMHTVRRALYTVSGACTGFMVGACAGVFSPVLIPTVSAIKLKKYFDKKKE